MFWGGLLMMLLGAVLFALGGHPLLSIAGTTLMGVCGSFTLVMIQATLSDHHGDLRAIALTESNVIAGVGAGITPLVVGLSQRSGVGWQFAPLLGCAYGLLLFMLFRRLPLPPMREDDSPSPTATRPVVALPLSFWAYWLIIYLSVAVEWSVIAWGADFLETQVGLRKVLASTLMSVFFLAFVLGRWGGSRLTRHYAPQSLLLGSFGLLLLGFLPFWLAPLPPLNVAGLFLAGLGVSNLFPMALSVASGLVTPRQSDRASGRVALGAGLAVLTAPQVLGTLADALGIQQAFGVVPLLIGLALLVLWWVRGLGAAAHPPAPQRS